MTDPLLLKELEDLEASDDDVLSSGEASDFAEPDESHSYSRLVKDENLKKLLKEINEGQATDRAVSIKITNNYLKKLVPEI